MIYVHSLRFPLALGLPIEEAKLTGVPMRNESLSLLDFPILFETHKSFNTAAFDKEE
jgi:hypothetical protein